MRRAGKSKTLTASQTFSTGTLITTLALAVVAISVVFVRKRNKERRGEKKTNLGLN